MINKNRAPESVQTQLKNISQGYHLALARNNTHNFIEYCLSEILQSGFSLGSATVTLPILFGEDEEKVSKDYDDGIRSLLKEKELFIIVGLNKIQILHDGTEILGVVETYLVPDGLGVRIEGAKETVTLVKKWILNKYKTVEVPQIQRVVFNRYNQAVLAVETVKINIPEEVDFSYLYPDFASPEKVLNDFMKSNSRVLLMIGDPGTGKSTFAVEMLKYRGWKKNNIIVDDQEVMEHPGIIGQLREGNDIFVILEDADGFIESREIGNKKMTALLNMSAGIASPNIRIVILTNLPSVNKVDSALIRPGRCFDIMKFRKLNCTEANAARRSLGKSEIYSDDTRTYTLSEIFNDKDHVTETPKRSIGFVQNK